MKTFLILLAVCCVIQAEEGKKRAQGCQKKIDLNPLTTMAKKFKILIVMVKGQTKNVFLLNTIQR